MRATLSTTGSERERRGHAAVAEADEILELQIHVGDGTGPGHDEIEKHRVRIARVERGHEDTDAVLIVVAVGGG